jgi:hypothetical protein
LRNVERITDRLADLGDLHRLPPMKRGLVFTIATRGTHERGLLLREILAAELDRLADDVWEEHGETIFQISPFGRGIRYSKFLAFNEVRLQVPGRGGGAIVLTLASRSHPLISAGVTLFLLGLFTVSRLTGGDFPWFFVPVPAVLGAWTVSGCYFRVRAWWRSVSE